MIPVVLIHRGKSDRYPLETVIAQARKFEGEHPLKGEPKAAKYDEVWENDEGRSSFSSAYRFKRKYGHRLQKKGK